MPESRRGTIVLATVAGLDLVVHLALSGRYGYWIDELYFIACGEHLAWGYADHPPLIAVAAKASRLLFGDSVTALRVFPALSAAAIAFLTGWIARALGGGPAAQGIAAVAACVAPLYALFGGVLTMNSFEPLFWMTCVYLVIRMAQGADQKLWVGVGTVAGFGLLNKHSMAFFVAALVGGLLVSPQRRLLMTRWLWIGGGVAAAIALPHVMWQRAHDWPTIELLANAQRYQHQPVTPLEFVWGQIQIIGPLSFPLWAAGLWYLLFYPGAARYRFLGWTFVIQFFVFLTMQAKNYYLGPSYPMLLAAGGVMVEAIAPERRRNAVVAAVIVVLLVGFVPLAPYVLPILPIEKVPEYMRLLGLKEVRAESRPMGNVPQIFADMLGWEQLVAEVARVYESLPPEDRRKASLWGRDYGVAGAIDRFGPAYGLPTAISGHQNYYLWGPDAASGEVMIAISFPREVLVPWFESVEPAGKVECDLCMPDRRVTPIFVARGLKVPMADFWRLTKCWTCDRPAFASGVPRAAPAL